MRESPRVWGREYTQGFGDWSAPFGQAFRGDRKLRVEVAGQEVETMMGKDPPNPKDAWRRLKGWYKAAVNRAPPPA